MEIRTLLKLDAAFEAVLALALLVAGAAGWLTAADLPSPVGRGAVIAAGAALALLAVALIALARTGAGRRTLGALAAVNEVTALVALLWLLAAHGFSAGAAALVAITIAGLMALSTLQLRAVVTGSPGSPLLGK